MPLIGANVKGPAGIAMLPRLWLKAILADVKLLPPEYVADNSGTNKLVLDGLGIDANAAFAQLAAQPAYAVFERWIVERGASQAAVDATNAAIAAQQKPPENAELVRSRVGLAGTAESGAALMNALDDWTTVHERVVRERAAPKHSIVPALSSQSVGPLGLIHLPRLWMKATLAATGALHPGWSAGRDDALDMRLSKLLGLDFDSIVAYIEAHLPPYVPFERWIVQRSAGLLPADVAAHNTTLRMRFGNAIDRTDQHDWTSLYTLVTAK